MADPIDNYADIQVFVQKEIKDAISANAQQATLTATPVPAHAHTGTDSMRVEFDNLQEITRYPYIRIVQPTTDTTVANVVGGDFTMPFGGYIEWILAVVDTAGTTNTTTIDVNNATLGVSILSTKITIDSTEKTSYTAATPYVIIPKYKAFSKYDIFTFDVDAINTTAAKGLSIIMKVIEIP